MEVLWVLTAGLVGTSAMIALMTTIHHLKWANADMVRAIGSIYTRSYEDSFFPGLLLHYSVGVSLAFVYALIVGMAPVATPGAIVMVSTGLGLAHGVIVGLMLAAFVAENHPVGC